MKTLKVLSFLLAAMLTFNACGDDDDKVVNNLENEYFTIENGKFVGDNLTGGSQELIKELSVNDKVINGGTSIISVSSEKELASLLIGVKEQIGYYECTLIKKEVVSGVYDYDAVIRIIQNILVKNFTLAICAVATDGTVSTLANSESISIVEAGTGDLQISLSWDQESDVDLHVYDPSGNHVFYNNRKITKDGETIVNLDIDSNAGCSIDGIRNENIYFSDLANGVYEVYVNLYKKCNLSLPGAKYSISVNHKGSYVKISDVMKGQYQKDYSGYMYIDKSKFSKIGTFTISNDKITAGGEYVESKSNVRTVEIAEK